jgi:hypothetical protein
MPLVNPVASRRQSGAKPVPRKSAAGPSAVRPNGAGKRGRGRPSKAPEIIALLPALRAVHGPRLLLDDVVAAAVSQGVLEHAEPGTPIWNGRRQVVRRALVAADLGDLRIEGL